MLQNITLIKFKTWGPFSYIWVPHVGPFVSPTLARQFTSFNCFEFNGFHICNTTPPTKLHFTINTLLCFPIPLPSPTSKPCHLNSSLVHGSKKAIAALQSREVGEQALVHGTEVHLQPNVRFLFHVFYHFFSLTLFVTYYCLCCYTFSSCRRRWKMLGGSDSC